MKTNTIILIVVGLLIVGSILHFEGQKATPAPGPVEPLRPAAETASAEGEVPASTGAAPNPKDELYPKAPELTGIVGYLNTKEGLTIKSLRGKVVMVDFWTYSCINCIRTLPKLVEWYDKYADKGLVIIGVHTPEFEFEKDKANVLAAMEKYGITYPVVQDNDYGTWRAYANRYWPRKYLIDAEGYIRYDHIGEGGYEETEEVIQQLLGEKGEQVDVAVKEDAPAAKHMPTTPELYAGYENALPRGLDIGNDGSFRKDMVFAYTLPEFVPKNQITLQGMWHAGAEELRAEEDNASIVLRYTGREVNIVASGPALMKVFVDSKPVGEDLAGSDVTVGSESVVMIGAPQLYNVIAGEHGEHELRLVVEKGFTFNAFTFG